jgi:hypothetical protein
MDKFIVNLKIVSANNLVTKDYKQCKEPYCEVRAKHDQVFRTDVSSEAIWNQTFTLRIDDPVTDTVEVIVFDQSRGTEDSLGYCVVKFFTISPDKLFTHTYPLQQAPFGTISLELTLKDIAGVISPPTNINISAPPQPFVNPKEIPSEKSEDIGKDLPALNMPSEQHLRLASRSVRNCSTPTENVYTW